RIESTPDTFEGYTTTEMPDASIVAVFDVDRRQTSRITAGQQGYVVLDRTPFYVESGGQVSDSGQLLVGNERVADVVGMARIAPGRARAHLVTATRDLTPGNTVTARVEADLRN